MRLPLAAPLLSLVTALGAAAAEPAHPKAGLVVPPSLKRQRAPEPLDEDTPAALTFAAPEVLEAAGPLKASPGSWVEYEVRFRGQPEQRVRLSVLPAVEGDGRYWLEVVTAGVAFPVAAKLLVHGSPLHAADVERLLLLPVGQSPLEIPLDDAREKLPRETAAKGVKVTSLGERKLTVPAGTFHVAQLRVQGKEGVTRVSFDRAQVPLWGLVRSVGQGRTVELSGWGYTGAHTIFAPGPGEPDERPDAGVYGNGSESVK